MSPGLAKAHLIELKSDGTPKDAGVPVQFNPATMKLTISNSTEGGESQGRQTRQFLGLSSTVLAIELIFDTADEGDTGHPRSVRTRTAIVEKYVLPVAPTPKKEAPPKLRFAWGPLVLDGVVDSITIDIDHFAMDGTPLRAKVGLSLKEQKPANQLKPTSNTPAAPNPGTAGGGLPGSGAGISTESGVAIGGETAADFSVRVGLDPTAWRGLDFGASASLSLDAGLEVGFSEDLSAGAGLGVTAGFEAGVSASLEASVGLDVSASVGLSASASFSADVSAGLAVSAAGGVSAAIAQVQSSAASAAVQQTAQAFNLSLPADGTPPVQATAAAALASPPAAQLGPPDQPRPALAQVGLPSLSQQAAAAPAPPLPRIDPRAASFGFGVPLRSQIGPAAADRSDLTAGGATLRAAVGSGDPPITSNPAIPPWVALPAAEFAVDTAGAIQLKRRPQPSCGCAGKCHCKGRT